MLSSGFWIKQRHRQETGQCINCNKMWTARGHRRGRLLARFFPSESTGAQFFEILDQSNGAAAASDVIETLGEQMQDVLTPRDYETLAMGEVRWRNRARFARLRMTERGLLSSTSHRGIWEITELGREYLGHTPATPGEADSV